MLEIELQNRLDAKAFQSCDTKLAFLPHCLHDLTVECKSVIRGEDYVCKGCSGGCNINAVFKLLRRHEVQPYIWMTANLRALFKRLKREGRHVGVLGIACIPELVRGYEDVRCGRRACSRNSIGCQSLCTLVGGVSSQHDECRSDRTLDW